MATTSTSNTLTDANHAEELGKLLYESAVFQDVSTAAQAAVKVLAGMEVALVTPAASAISRVVVGTYPFLAKMSSATRRISRRLSVPTARA